MAIDLPTPLDIYFASETAHDRSAIERCFAADAVVRDEGRTIKGIAAIKAWRVETSEKYHHTVEPVAVSMQDGRVDEGFRPVPGQSDNSGAHFQDQRQPD